MSDIVVKRDLNNLIATYIYIVIYFITVLTQLQSTKAVLLYIEAF